MEIDYKHTWVLPRRSLVVRFYMWLWDASPSQVNFCKLFWGYLFAVPALLFRLFAFPFVVAATELRKLMPPPKKLTEEEHEAREARRLVRVARRDERAQRWLDHISAAGVRLVWAITFLWRFLRYPFMAVFWGANLVCLAYLLYLMGTTWRNTTVDILLYTGIFAGVLIFVALPLAVGFGALVERGKLDWVITSVEWTAPRVLIAAGAPFVFFFWVMKMGFISVKSNTCPRIELKD